jgi:transposase-like protein
MNHSKAIIDRYLPPTPNETQMYWFRQLQQQESSGLSMPEYAKQHGLSKHTLRVWSQLLRIPKQNPEEPTPLFQPVQVLDAQASSAPASEITLSLQMPNGIECELHFDQAQTGIAMLQSLARLML